MKVIGIDIGSSFTKCALFDMNSGRILRVMKQTAIPRIVLEKKDRFEVPADKIVEQVRDMITEMTNSASDISGIVFSVQMHGFVLHAESDIEPRYISWQDRRCLETEPGKENTWLDELKEIFDEKEMRCSGLRIKSSLALSNMFVQVNEEFPSDKGGEFFTLGSYIIKALTGKNICHITSAAPTGMVDLYTQEWNRKVIKTAGFSRFSFPEIINDLSECGNVEINGQHMKVYPDIGDQQATVLGCCPVRNDLVINIGTAAQISQLEDSLIQGTYEIRPYFENSYLNTITDLPGGRNLDVLMNFIIDIGRSLFDRDIHKEEIWKTLDNGNDWLSDGLTVDLNFFKTVNGSAPYGKISNISADNLKLKSLFAAAYESIADAYSKCESLLTENTTKPERVLFSGGRLSQQEALVQAITKKFGLQGVLATHTDTVLNGLYRIAQVSLGQCLRLEETMNINTDNSQEAL